MAPENKIEKYGVCKVDIFPLEQQTRPRAGISCQFTKVPCLEKRIKTASGGSIEQYFSRHRHNLLDMSKKRDHLSRSLIRVNIV